MAWHSTLAEQSVLGGLFLAPDTFPDVSMVVRGADFVKPGHQLIFAAVADLIADNADPDAVAVAELLERRGQLKDAGGMEYIFQLAGDTPSAANIRAHADTVADCAKRRRLRELFADAAQQAETVEDVGALLGSIMPQAENVAMRGRGTDLSFAEAWDLAINAMDDAAHARGGIVGVPMGIAAIEQRTGGLMPSRLIVAAGRPGIGKTALANQIALYAAQHGYPVGIMHLEMSAVESMQRAMANVYGLNVSGLAFGLDAELSKLTKASGAKSIANLPIRMDCDTYDLGGIVARLSEWRGKHRIELAIIDHIGLIDGGDNLSRNDHLGKITRTLKLTAKRLGIPILALCQLNRSVERDKRRPVLADLRDSGSIEQDADVCIFLHADGNAERTAAGNPLEIGILKNRVGMAGWLPERFAFDGRTQRIREMAQEQRFDSGFDRAAGG